MKMKEMLEEQPSPAISNSASSSGLSRNCDQETGPNAISIHGLAFSNFSTSLCLLQGMDLNPARMLIAEMMGTFILVFCICGITAGTEITKDQVDLLQYAATSGLAVIVLCYSIGPISGAHFNPAITIAFATFGHFPWSRVPFYALAQTVGSTSAAFVAKFIYSVKSDLFVTQPLDGCDSAFWVEFIATFIVMFLNASMTYQPSVAHFSGFVIGLAIGLAVLITTPISGGSMNPARSLGPAIVSWNFNYIWVYIGGPISGAVAGALLCLAVRIQPPPPCQSTLSSSDGLLGHSIAFGEN